jgi:hypothetical protein
MRVLGLVILIPSLFFVGLCVLSLFRSSRESAAVAALLLIYNGIWPVLGAGLVFLGTRKGWFCRACGTPIKEQCTVCPACHAELDLPL